MIAAPADALRDRLVRREWIVTVETVTPAPGDDSARARILGLADALRTDDRVAALTLTDRTTSLEADPVTLVPRVAARSAKAALVHVAGKARDRGDVERMLRCATAAGVTSVLLTGGDPLAGSKVDALEMLRLARGTAPGLVGIGVLAPAPGRPIDDAWDRAAAKRDAGAVALVAQVTWDLDVREVVAGWQARLGIPIVGAVMPLTRARLDFLAHHRITGIAVPPALRRRVGDEAAGAATRRLALDLLGLRRLGYAGAHVSGLLTPSRVTGVLDETARLAAALGDDWHKVWRDAVAIA